MTHTDVEEIVEEFKNVFPSQPRKDRDPESPADFVEAEANVLENWLRTTLTAAINAAREEEKLYRDAVHEAYNVGFNVDCALCGLKDKALGEVIGKEKK